MKKEEDIYQIYNELDELIKSIKLDDKKEINLNTNNTKTNIENTNENVPEMPKVFLDEEKNPVVYKEKTQDEKDLIKAIEKEEQDKKLNEEKTEIKKEKNNKKQKKKKKKSKKWVITFAFLDIIAIICLFLMYGPISYFRNLWVTSAMTTMTHKYLAYIFFNQEQIDIIMNNNVIIEVEGNTNQEEIQFEEPQEEQIVYSSPEEEQVLTKDPGNDLYKVIDIEGNGYKGHLLVIYDPSKIELAQITNRKYGLMIEQFVKRYGAVAGINAGGFRYSSSYGYSPTGVVIIDGQIVDNNGSTGWGGGIVGFTNDNVLVLTKASAQEAIQMGIRDAISFGPFLIVNGVASQFRGNGGYGIAPRTAIGQRKDGIVLMLVIDGRRPGHSLGVDMVELTNIMLRYGAYNASNLDGGGSSTIVVNGETLSVAGGSGYSGDRYLPNAWLLMP